MSELQDKAIICKECQTEFVFTVDDQVFCAQKGFKEPKRCKNCRRLRRDKAKASERGSHV